MHPKLNLINSFQEKKTKWEENEKTLPRLRELKTLPNMPGITKKTAQWLRLKSLYYLLRYDKNRIFLRYVLKKPFTYGFSLLRSYLKKQSYHREKDFFFYGLKNTQEFEEKAKNALFVLGFSYCHKPFECPSGRFTDKCIHDPNHPVCGKCFIGKCAHLTHAKTRLLFIPTVHYIGEKMLEIVHENSNQEVIFMITACEMTLKMFSDWGNMIGVRGIGVRLDGRICNTMKAFELSEKGTKPGLTVVLEETKEQMLDLIQKHSDAQV